LFLVVVDERFLLGVGFILHDFLGVGRLEGLPVLKRHGGER